MRRSRSSSCLRIIGLITAIASFALIVIPGRTSAHIPITTKITFDREVVRILQRNCSGCHRTGGIAFPVATYDDARPWAKDLEYEVLRRQMPFWRVMKGYGDFSNAPQMTIRDTEVLVNWVENGVPEGDAKDLPKAQNDAESWQLGNPDLILKPESSVSIPANQDRDETITIPTSLKTDHWVRAIDFKPQGGAVAQFAEIYADAANDPPGNSERPAGHLLGYWMPGQKTVSLPSRAGILLKAGSKLVVRVHYHGTNSSASDLSEVGLYFTPTRPAREIDQVDVDLPQLNVPVSTAPQRVTANYKVTEDSELLALRPAANPLIASFQATAYRPDGSVKVLIWTTRAKWNWAPIYYERRPVLLPKGTRVETAVYFDNSDSNKLNPNSPAKEVRWSGVSNDPFCTLMLANKASD